MKKTFISAAALLACAMTANADIVINLPANSGISELEVNVLNINDEAKAKRDTDLAPEVYEIAVVNNSATIKGAPYNAHYYVPLNEEGALSLFVAPQEDVIVNVESLLPLKFNAVGTPLMEGISKIQNILEPKIEEFAELEQLYSAGQLTDLSRLDALEGEVHDLMKQYVLENPNDPSAIFAMLNINDPEMFLECYDAIIPLQENSIMAPYARQNKEAIDAQLRKQKLQQGLSNAIAPDFTLNDLDGKPFTLSSLRGKWVVLDFWGSWCGWCIKGMPAMKDAYKKYDGKLEIVGIDCGDTVDDWKSAVKRLGIPWINVYNAPQDNIPGIYGVQGFPTKVIINPEGKVVNVITGEDPKFYTLLEEYIK